LFGLIYMVFMVRFSLKKFNKAIWCTIVHVNVIFHS
jgi:hypothetical protein